MDLTFLEDHLRLFANLKINLPGMTHKKIISDTQLGPLGFQLISLSSWSVTFSKKVQNHCTLYQNYIGSQGILFLSVYVSRLVCCCSR
jgi:hypothetical protein